MVVLMGLALAGELAAAPVRMRMGANSADRNGVGQIDSFIVEIPVKATWRLILISTA
jgi:hypothetical protein